MSKIKLIFGLFATLSFISCGGGGGSGDSRGDKNGIRILNAAIDSLPLEAVLNGAVLEGSLSKFALTSLHKSIGGGKKIVSIAPHLSPTQTLFNIDSNFQGNLGYSALIYGNREDGLNSKLFTDNIPQDLSSSNAAVRVINGVTKASTIVVAFTGGTVTPALNLASASSYITLPTGAVEATTSNANGVKISSAGLVLEGGKSYTLLVAGEMGYFVKSLVLED